MTKKDYSSVTLRDNSKARVVSIDSVSFVGTTQVEQVLLVDGLKHNLLSISQLCDEGNIVTFEHDKCIIRSPESKETRAFGCRCFVLNNGKDHLGKFDSKADEGICTFSS